MSRAIEDMQTASVQVQLASDQEAESAFADDEVSGVIESGGFILVPERLIPSILRELNASPIGIGCYGVHYGGQYFELRSLDVWTPQLRSTWPGVQQALFGRAAYLQVVLERLGVPIRNARGSLLDPLEERLAQMTLV